MKPFLLVIVIVDPKTGQMEYSFSQWRWSDEAFEEGVEKFNELKAVGISDVSYRVYDIKTDKIINR